MRSSMKSILVATAGALLCVVAFAVSLGLDETSVNELLVVLAAPFVLQALPLLYLLLRPGVNAVNTSLVVAAIGLAVALFMLQFTLLDWAMSSNPTSLIINLAYVACQLWVVIHSLKWRRQNHQHFAGRE